MTDNEIVKALECCQQTRCMECPLWKKRHNCMNKLYEYALDLINRKKSQILKEQNKNSKLRNERNHLKAEIERLKTNLNIDLENFATEYDNKIKAEAVKEFADNLIKDIKSHRTEMNLNGLKGTHRTDEITYQTVIEYIDNLVKEMVGDNNA